MGNDNTVPNRTGFGNHAFASYGGMVYDACAGPAQEVKQKRHMLRQLLIIPLPQKLLRQGIQAIFQRKQLEP